MKSFCSRLFEWLSSLSRASNWYNYSSDHLISLQNCLRWNFSKMGKQPRVFGPGARLWDWKKTAIKKVKESHEKVITLYEVEFVHQIVLTQISSFSVLQWVHLEPFIPIRRHSFLRSRKASQNCLGRTCSRGVIIISIVSPRRRFYIYIFLNFIFISLIYPFFPSLSSHIWARAIWESI